MIGKLLYMLVAGGLGGVIAWLITEPLLSPDSVRIQSPEGYRQLVLFGMIGGASIGMMIGLASGFAQGSKAHAGRGFVGGLGVGLIGGALGITFGQAIFSLLVKEISPYNPNAAEIAKLVIARTLGWGTFGALLGLSEGIVGRSWRRMQQGAIGGLIGGGGGGLLFDLVGCLSLPLLVATDPGRFTPEGVGEIGIFSRGIALSLMGAAIGLFIGLLEVLTRHAWIRVVMGRNEGKEYPLDRPTCLIGRHELADVPLFGDPNVAPTHAQVIRRGGVYTLVDGGTPAGTFLNGQRITQAPLRDGDRINIGGFTLLFREKAGAAAKRARDLQRAVPPPPPVPEGVCPFCGQRKDPLTGMCACAVPTAPGATAAPISLPGGATLGTAAVVMGQATTLRALDGILAGQSFPISPAGLSVGREQGRDLVLPDPTVSRRHARFVFEQGQLVLYDEGSTNGTFVNEQRITRQMLKPGDIVRIGQFRFQVE